MISFWNKERNESHRERNREKEEGGEILDENTQ